MTLATILILTGAYLIGALPSAYLVGRRHGVCLRELGDGNLGTRNTLRVLGLKPALCVGALDIGKGALATWLATLLSDNPLIPYGAALSAAIGHDFSIYIRFSGGMGMATVLGSALVLHPVESLLGLEIPLRLRDACPDRSDEVFWLRRAWSVPSRNGSRRRSMSPDRSARPAPSACTTATRAPAAPCSIT